MPNTAQPVQNRPSMPQQNRPIQQYRPGMPNTAQPVQNRPPMPQQNRPVQQYRPGMPNTAQPVQNRPPMPQQNRPVQQYRPGMPNTAQPVQNRPASPQNYQAPRQYRPPVPNNGNTAQPFRPAAPVTVQPAPTAPVSPSAEQTNTPAAADNAQTVGMLVCTKGGDMGENFVLKTGKNRIGVSAECTVRIKDDSLTAEHDFEIVYDEQRKLFSLVPGKNASKLFLNNESIDSAVFMRAHDTIKTGQTEYLLVVF